MIGDDASGDLVAVAQALTASMDGLAQQVGVLNAQVDAQESYGHRNRRMIWGLVAALFLIAVLTVAVAMVAVQADHASGKATQVRTQQISACVSSNEVRANNKRLWDYLFSLPPTKPRTTEQDTQIQNFRAFVNKTFAPRDCSKI
jgi:hypothetical protein